MFKYMVVYDDVREAFENLHLACLLTKACRVSILILRPIPISSLSEVQSANNLRVKTRK